MNNEISARQVRRLMVQNHVTIRQVAARFGVSMERVRQVRKVGGAWDWPLMITTIAQERAH